MTIGEKSIYGFREKEQSLLFSDSGAHLVDHCLSDCDEAGVLRRRSNK